MNDDDWCRKASWWILFYSFDIMMEELFVLIRITHITAPEDKVRSLSESDLSDGIRAVMIESKYAVTKQAGQETILQGGWGGVHRL